jgi:diamine N-acetyltransferase
LTCLFKLNYGSGGNEEVERTVYLRAFEQEDIKELQLWLNDPESIRMVGRKFKSYDETVIYVQQKKTNGDLVMAIEKQDGQMIGWGFLKNIEYEHGRAGIGILLAPEHRGCGYGQQAMELMIDIGFKQLRLNKIYLTTREFNERAVKLYIKLGFVVEGKLRKHAFIDGKYHDTFFMSLLSEEYEESMVNT